MASLSQGRTAGAQFGLFTHKSVPVIFEPPCTYKKKELCVKLAFYKDYTNMHGQQNVKFCNFCVSRRITRAAVFTCALPCIDDEETSQTGSSISKLHWWSVTESLFQSLGLVDESLQ